MRISSFFSVFVIRFNDQSFSSGEFTVQNYTDSSWFETKIFKKVNLQFSHFELKYKYLAFYFLIKLIKIIYFIILKFLNNKYVKLNSFK